MTCPRACALPCPLALAPPSAAPPMGAAANAPPDHGQRRHVATPARAHTHSLTHTLCLLITLLLSLSHIPHQSLTMSRCYTSAPPGKDRNSGPTLSVSLQHTHTISLSLSRGALSLCPAPSPVLARSPLLHIQTCLLPSCAPASSGKSAAHPARAATSVSKETKCRSKET